MKISDMQTKKSIEVNDNDLLIIEDNEDTKSITVSELKNYMTLSLIDNPKYLINMTIDNIIDALSKIKFVLPQDRNIDVFTYIKDTSTVIISLKENEKYFTLDDINNLIASSVEGSKFTFKILVNEVYETSTTYTVNNANEVFTGLEDNEIIKELYEKNIGVINITFNPMDQNNLSLVTYNDIIVELPKSENYIFNFTSKEDLFINNISFKGEV